MKPVYRPLKTYFTKDQHERMERETGIEPASLAWKARVLPLNYSRLNLIEPRPERVETILFALVEEAGFEPAYS